MRNTLLLLGALALVSCKKEESTRVRLRAECGTCVVYYTNSEGGTSTKLVKRAWELEQTMPAGSTLEFQACPIDTGVTITPDVNWASVTIWAFANSSPYSFASEGTLWPDSCASFSATVPEP